ncbi:MAG TPA: mannose-1-phosphate guanylyltransferase/mannose-6-phosphate isomerase [Hyphomicrobiaceae bacterium]|nr:mannose-1-phosphate guanylyltransferase/mannose-6-phosphate isomerase [Hyphomicrobiaceae bacterium]
MAIIQPVVLSGGAGTRLWPVSRARFPKQFIPFTEVQPESFLTAALKRLGPELGFAAPMVVCNSEHRFLVKDEAGRSGIRPSAIVLEPMARNTAPAVAVAALMALRDDPEAIIVVMPSDHVIRDVPQFATAVRKAAEIANTGKLVLFGIRPSEPNTGYGYIRRGKPLTGFDGAFAVAAFTEKPNREVAEEYLASASYDWNSGIFVLGARTFLSELERLEPAILEAAQQALGAAVQDDDQGFLRLDARSFERAPAKSIDYALMEHTALAAVMPIDVGWNDVGSWSSLWELSPHDKSGNAVHGDALLHDTQDCYVHSDKSLVATLGVKDLVIVDTPDALLVADRGRAQDVGTLVTRLKAAGRTEHESQIRNHRPWGYFETLNIGPRFQVKLLHVKPGGKLSLQMHHHRSEHWVVVHGTARVTVGDSERLVHENQSVYIVATEWHRLENPGKTPLEIIEVQIGSYLGEDDIVRSDDVYKRSADETK